MTLKSLIKCVLCLFAAVISISAAASDASDMMRLELKDGKIIAQIPRSLMGRRLLMASRIEQTSDSGEGLAGQLSDNCIAIVFSLEDKELLITMPIENALNKQSASAGVWKRYKVTSFKPDSTAVVDLTDLFKTQYSQLHTFPTKAYNSMGGQVRRVHTLVKDKSKFLSTDVRDSIASVLCDFYYKMDGYVMGVMKIAGDYSVRAQVRKMIFLPPANDKFPQIRQHSAVETDYLQQRSIVDSLQPVSAVNMVRRWRVQPSDSLAWEAGNLVAPVRPIVFHLDTLIPANWQPYVREGILAWNKAFEKAGLSSVLNVRDFQSDPTTFSASPYLSRVIFAPSGMEEIEVGYLYDPQTGEIFSGQICLHSNFMKKQHRELLKSAAATSARVRCEDLPDSIAGQLIRISVMKAVGKALGLRDLPKKDRIELEKTDLDQDAPGCYEQNAVAWLYGPSSCRSEEALDELEKSRTFSGADYFDDLEEWVESQKPLFADVFNYFPDASDEFIVSVVTGIQDQYAKNIVKLFQFVGGYERTVYGVSTPYPASIQSRAVCDVIAHLKDMDWFKSVPKGRLPYSTNEFIADVYRTNIFKNLLDRFSKVRQCASVSGAGGYGTEAFLKDVSSAVFGASGTARIRLMPIEMVWQNAYVSFVLNKMAEDVSCYKMVRQLRSKIYNASVSATGEIADHYSYLLFVIDKKLNE